jgi:hypothetical protein
MKFFNTLMFLAAIGLLFSCTGEKNKTTTKTDANGYTYESVSNDPMKTRVYTLENGLKVFLSINKDEPRISTLIGVKSRSNFRPGRNHRTGSLF